MGQTGLSCAAHLGLRNQHVGGRRDARKRVLTY